MLKDTNGTGLELLTAAIHELREEMRGEREAQTAAFEDHVAWLLEHARAETRAVVGADEATRQAELGRLQDEIIARIVAEQGARERTDEAVRGVHHDLLQRADNLSRAVQEEIVARERAEARLAALEQVCSELAVATDELRREIQRIRARATDGPPPPTMTGTSQQSTTSGDDVPADLYLAIEDRFRGSREAVSDMQRLYLPYLEAVVTPDRPLVDLGAGRGELVKICADAGLAAYGIDGNPESVRSAQQDGADVRLGELTDFLVTAEAGSVGAITLMHVVEHFPLTGVVDLLRSAQRALAPGGLLVAETPNPTNVRVGAGTFWIDPTHHRPLHPDLLAFLAQTVGFERVEILPLHPARPEPELDGLPEGAVEALRDAWEALSGPQDYALLAWTLRD